MGNRPFRRASHSAFVYGICAGLAYYLAIPVLPIRLLCLLLIIGTFPIAFLIYVGLFYTLPEWSIEPDDFETIHAWK